MAYLSESSERALANQKGLAQLGPKAFRFGAEKSAVGTAAISLSLSRLRPVLALFLLRRRPILLSRFSVGISFSW